MAGGRVPKGGRRRKRLKRNGSNGSNSNDSNGLNGSNGNGGVGVAVDVPELAASHGAVSLASSAGDEAGAGEAGTVAAGPGGYFACPFRGAPRGGTSRLTPSGGEVRRRAANLGRR